MKAAVEKLCAGHEDVLARLVSEGNPGGNEIREHAERHHVQFIGGMALLHEALAKLESAYLYATTHDDIFNGQGAAKFHREIASIFGDAVAREMVVSFKKRKGRHT